MYFPPLHSGILCLLSSLPTNLTVSHSVLVEQWTKLLLEDSNPWWVGAQGSSYSVFKIVLSLMNLLTKKSDWSWVCLCSVCAMDTVKSAYILTVDQDIMYTIPS